MHIRQPFVGWITLLGKYNERYKKYAYNYVNLNSSNYRKYNKGMYWVDLYVDDVSLTPHYNCINTI